MSDGIKLLRMADNHLNVEGGEEGHDVPQSRSITPFLILSDLLLGAFIFSFHAPLKVSVIIIRISSELLIF